MSATATAKTIHVSGLSANSTEHSVSQFFSFCGHVENITFNSGAHTADVVFAKPGAAKTASFLNGASLDGAAISVTWAGEGHEHEEEAAHAAHEDIKQEDKPRSAIAAEYLAHGYSLSDKVVSQSIAMDKQYGLTQRFLSFFNPLADAASKKWQEVDQKHKITEQASTKATETDSKYGLSQKAASAQSIGKAYYERALASSFGKQVQNFYSDAARQVQDVHEEAKRIADSKKTSSGEAIAASGPATTAPATGTAATTAPTHATAPGVSTAPVTDVK